MNMVDLKVLPNQVEERRKKSGLFAESSMITRRRRVKLNFPEKGS